MGPVGVSVGAVEGFADTTYMRTYNNYKTMQIIVQCSAIYLPVRDGVAERVVGRTLGMVVDDGLNVRVFNVGRYEEEEGAEEDGFAVGTTVEDKQESSYSERYNNACSTYLYLVHE